MTTLASGKVWRGDTSSRARLAGQRGDSGMTTLTSGELWRGDTSTRALLAGQRGGVEG